MNLNIEQGEFISIVGPSGSGKTTLLHLLGCLDNPNAGTLQINGKDVFANGKAMPDASSPASAPPISAMCSKSST